MTPYETSLFIKDYQEKKKAENNEEISLTYVQALWTAQWFTKHKPPKLEKILGVKEEQTPMTPEEILKQVKEMNQALGGKIY